MKRSFILLLLFFTFSFGLSAQETANEAAPNGGVAPNGDGKFSVYKEYPWSLGANIEMGLHTRDNFAPGYGITLARHFSPLFALGLRGTMYNDADTVTAMEAMLNLRLYRPITDFVSLFAQLGFGGSFYSEEGRNANTYAMDFIAGTRVYLRKPIILDGFYIEPYVRVGYPFMFSGGLAAGHWFKF